MIGKKQETEEYLRISKDYKSRSKEETECLYAYIASLLDDVNGGNEKDISDAINDLIVLFKPIILKFSSYYYSKVKEQYEYDDVVQEGYLLFISCIYNYNKELSAFPHYIKDNYPKYFYTWAKNIWKYSDKISDAPFDDMVHPHYDEDDKVFSRLLEDLYAREYTQFITNLSQKYSKTDTHRIVCEDYFLGNRSCLDIATELNISYHAVYDCIRKIKRDFNYYIKNNKNFDCYFGSDSEIIFKKEGYEK